MSSATTGSKLYLGMWFFYPLLVPFYLMGKTPVPGQEKVEGGVPQLADYYLAGLMCLVFSRLPLRLSRRAVPVVAAFTCFVCYTVFINFVWATILEDLSLLKSSLFYVYDCLLFLTCLILYAAYKEQFLKVTVYSVAASVVLQVVLSPFAPQQASSRQELFFNNENQLGYYCVLAASIFVVGTRHFPFRLRYQLLFYGAVAYLVVPSQCRAALLAMATLSVIAFLGRPVRLLLVLAVLIALRFILIMTPSVVPKSAERLVTGGQYDTLATRGYDRIINHPEHILFGAGEGAYQRFRSDLYGSEIHSSYGTLLFCYGIPGTVFFTLGLLFICKADPKYAIFMIPGFVFGTAHHGLRFAFLWPMLAFLCCLGLGLEHPDLPPDATGRPLPGSPAPPGDTAAGQQEFQPAP